MAPKASGPGIAPYTYHIGGFGTAAWQQAFLRGKLALFKALETLFASQQGTHEGVC